MFTSHLSLDIIVHIAGEIASSYFKSSGLKGGLIFSLKNDLTRNEIKGRASCLRGRSLRLSIHFSTAHFGVFLAHFITFNRVGNRNSVWQQTLVPKVIQWFLIKFLSYFVCLLAFCCFIAVIYATLITLRQT